MEGLVIAAAELRRRVEREVPLVTGIRCHLVITADKLMLEPAQISTPATHVWHSIYAEDASRLAVIVVDCPDE